MADQVCLCRCHLGLRPSKGEIKAWRGVDGTDAVATLSACDSCRPRHVECADGARLCRCGHPKWKHLGDDGCAGTYTDRCRCLIFEPAELTNN